MQVATYLPAFGSATQNLGNVRISSCSQFPVPDLPPAAAAKGREIVGDPDADSLAPIDLDTIRAFCLAVAEEQHAWRLWAEYTNPFISAGAGQPYVNPLRAIINKAPDQPRRVQESGARFVICLTPCPSRRIMSVPIKLSAIRYQPCNPPSG